MEVWLRNSNNICIKSIRKNCAIDKVKFLKRSSEGKLTDRQYHVQDNSDVSHKYVKIYCNTNQFPALPFCGPNYKPYGPRGLSKHYHLVFNTKQGNGVCVILRIPCVCGACK